METPEVVWIKVGKYEHNLAKGVHVIHSISINTEEVTAAQLEAVYKKRTPHVRLAATKKTEPTTETKS